MPIRRDLLFLYETPEHQAAREALVKRAKNRCQWCHKPNGQFIRTRTDGKGHMFWAPYPDTGQLQRWFNKRGWPLRLEEFRLAISLPERIIRVACTMAHLNHNPADDSEANTRFLCQWDHLDHDRLHHHETRATRKDAARPVIQEATA